ncbi:AraC family transcriptional regulator [Mangrovimonas aestuarii]|uniref:AraC family transcriptional regulator n=1 Tax=Mangrovimonas aestuarii TaxID=3018443 RepID=UPI00237842F6|nr:AraC family transcriptional regulator [Mangrovimonas aestuarii]
MIVDVYKYFKENPAYNKLVGDDYLFVEYKCPLDVEKFKLWSASHLITYVINGRKDWITANETYEITAGDALFIPKGVYTTKQYFEVEYCVMLFFVNDDFISFFLKENPKLQCDSSSESKWDSIFKVDVDASFEALIKSIFEYLKTGQAPQELVELKFRELFFNIMLNPKNKSLTRFLCSLKNKTKEDIKSIMLQNFRYDLNMEEFAALCGKSLSSFKRNFKEEFNTTPGKWLANQRLNYAQTLLLGSELNINEICYESGFKNPSHFITLFKDHFNLPPNQYRVAHQTKA